MSVCVRYIRDMSLARSLSGNDTINDTLDMWDCDCERCIATELVWDGGIPFRKARLERLNDKLKMMCKLTYLR